MSTGLRITQRNVIVVQSFVQSEGVFVPNVVGRELGDDLRGLRVHLLQTMHFRSLFCARKQIHLDGVFGGDSLEGRSARSRASAPTLVRPRAP